MIRFNIQCIQDFPEGGDAGTGGKKGLTHFTFLGQDVSASLHQGFVVDAVKGFKFILPDASKKGCKGIYAQRIIIDVEQTGFSSFSTLKSELFSTMGFQATAQEELVIGVQEVIGGSFGDSIQEAFEGAEGTALARFVGTEYDGQTRTF